MTAKSPLFATPQISLFSPVFEAEYIFGVSSRLVIMKVQRILLSIAGGILLLTLFVAVTWALSTNFPAEGADTPIARQVAMTYSWVFFSRALVEHSWPSTLRAFCAHSRSPGARLFRHRVHHSNLPWHSPPEAAPDRHNAMNPTRAETPNIKGCMAARNETANAPGVEQARL